MPWKETRRWSAPMVLWWRVSSECSPSSRTNLTKLRSNSGRITGSARKLSRLWQEPHHEALKMSRTFLC